MRSILFATIGRDLRNLVHVSNAFRMVDGAKSIQAGDDCKTEARIVSAINANEGKIAMVKGHVYRGGIELIPSFHYCGRFIDCELKVDATEWYPSRQMPKLIEGVVRVGE